MGTLSYERASELLRYDAASGQLFWRVARGRLVTADSVAGHVRKSGYVQLIVDGRAYSGHRVTWLLCTGSWPTGEIDHIDCARSNNRFENLRLATRQTNVENRRKPATRSLSGHLGVSPRKGGRWLAQIQVRGRKHHLGIFTNVAEASEAYVAAKRKLHAGNTL